ncbi:MAG: inorganic diphosphatase [Actinomycetota bacterium]|nr:inorganic diphosphatase [Actinomycetota bacterium]
MSDDLIDVLVETPQGSRKKYEYDHERQALRLDRRLFSATVYPADYGFVPDTMGSDGEALDALVLAHEPTFPGCWVLARPIGVFWLAHDEGREAKIVAVPHGDPDWTDVADLDDLGDHLREEISHFFEMYRTLEPGRSPRPDGHDGHQAAMAVIAEARQRAQERADRSAQDDDDEAWYNEDMVGPGDLVI